MYEYGRENYEQAFEVLGPDFDATDLKVMFVFNVHSVINDTFYILSHRYKCYSQMVGASDEQLDVFNEVWYSVLLNTGRFSKGMHTVRFFITNFFIFT